MLHFYSALQECDVGNHDNGTCVAAKAADLFKISPPYGANLEHLFALTDVQPDSELGPEKMQAMPLRNDNITTGVSSLDLCNGIMTSVQMLRKVVLQNWTWASAESRGPEPPGRDTGPTD